jgi:hypothetical protein
MRWNGAVKGLSTHPYPFRDNSVASVDASTDFLLVTMTTECDPHATHHRPTRPHPLLPYLPFLGGNNHSASPGDAP